VGAASTALFAGAFTLLAAPFGPIAAALVAFVVCAPLNVAVNRRVTFSKRGSAGRARHYTTGLAVAAAPLVLDLVVLVALGRAGVTSIVAELVAVTVVNGMATALRFLVLRRWVFG
jgi:putative flippase GtrA